MRNYFNDLPKSALGASYWIFAVYLVLPLALMTAMSFKDANFIAFPIGNWTLSWYSKVVQDKQFLEASLYSIGIALATTVSATIIGVWIALLVSAENIWGKAVIFALACLPAVVPGLINAISMRIFIRAVDIPTGTFAIILAHTVHAVPLSSSWF